MGTVPTVESGFLFLTRTPVGPVPDDTVAAYQNAEGGCGGRTAQEEEATGHAAWVCVSGWQTSVCGQCAAQLSSAQHSTAASHGREGDRPHATAGAKQNFIQHGPQGELLADGGGRPRQHLRQLVLVGLRVRRPAACHRRRRRRPQGRRAARALAQLRRQAVRAGADAGGRRPVRGGRRAHHGQLPHVHLPARRLQHFHHRQRDRRHQLPAAHQDAGAAHACAGHDGGGDDADGGGRGAALLRDGVAQVVGVHRGRAVQPRAAGRGGAEHGVPGAGGAHAAGEHVDGRAAAHHVRRLHHHRHRHPHRTLHQRAHTAQNRHGLLADWRHAADGRGQQPDRQGAQDPQLAAAVLQRPRLRARLRVARHHQLRLLPDRLHHPLLRPG